uniref:Ribosomal protein S5 n=1 Tax=Babesia duncani TaxID=323732 RepID=A0A385GNI6_9APIC|nr:ribosomal protein S5 [Babesia duncani]
MYKYYNNNINYKITYFFNNKYNIYKNNQIEYKFNLFNYSYNTFLLDNCFIKKLKKIKISYFKVHTLILINKINSLTLESGRVSNYKIITGIGIKQGWIGIGENKSRIKVDAYSRSLYNSYKCIYNLNFICDDYKKFKYKNCKFSILNKIENKNNLKIYNNIMELINIKKPKFISYSSKNPVNILKSILYYF